MGTAVIYMILYDIQGVRLWVPVTESGFLGWDPVVEDSVKWVVSAWDHQNKVTQVLYHWTDINKSSLIITSTLQLKKLGLRKCKELAKFLGYWVAEPRSRGLQFVWCQFLFVVCFLIASRPRRTKDWWMISEELKRTSLEGTLWHIEVGVKIPENPLSIQRPEL